MPLHLLKMSFKSSGDTFAEEESDTSMLLPLCYTPNKRNTAEQDQQVGTSFPIDVERDVTEACSRQNCELISAVSYERNLAGSPEKLFSLELKLPASPSDSPNDKEAKGAPVSDFPSFQVDSGTSRDIYTWNLAKCDLPYSRSLNDEEKLLWPLQVCRSVVIC